MNVVQSFLFFLGELFNNRLHFIKIMKSVLFIKLTLRHIAVKLELFNADITYAGNPAAAGNTGKKFKILMTLK